MWRLAIRQLALGKTQSVLIALAIGAAISVILVLRGFEQGLYAQSRAMVMNRKADLFVTQAGVANFVAVRSSLPQLTRQRVEAVAGVAEAHPITMLPVLYGPERAKLPLILIVHDTFGGPTEIVQGRRVRGGRDIVLDAGLSQPFGLREGDPFVVSDFEFRIAGITKGNAALFSPFGFVSYDGMIDLFLESDIAPDISTFPLLSYLLVKLSAGADAGAVARAIEAQVPEVDALSPEQVARSDVALGRELFGPIMGALIALAYVIGVLVIGLIIYADVSNRRRGFAVMKALGFRVSHLLAGISAQTLLLLLAAAPLGVLFAFVLARSIETFAPLYRVDALEPVGLLVTLGGVVLIALAGSLLPMRMIVRTDPVLAFQEQ